VTIWDGLLSCQRPRGARWGFYGECEKRVYLWSKDRHFVELCAREGLDPTEVCFVGDHLNDIPVMKIAGLAIAFAPKDPELIKVTAAYTDDFRQIPKLIEELKRHEHS
jgi:phosphoserine phosphatase